MHDRVARNTQQALATLTADWAFVQRRSPAQRCADLSVWITPQHAEKDDAALVAKVLEGDGSWQL